MSAEIEAIEISDAEREAALRRIFAEMQTEMSGSEPADNAPSLEPGPIAGTIDSTEPPPS